MRARRRLLRTALSLLLLAGAVQTALVPRPSDLRVDRYGAGAPVTIAVHGSPGSRRDFVRLAPHLKGTVYALEMPGFGDSRPFARDYGADAAARRVLHFMDRRQIDRATVLGYSWGGAVAIETAFLAPARVEGIVLLASMGITAAEPIPVYPLERLRYLLSAPSLLLYPGAWVLDLATRHGFLRSYIDTDLAAVEAHLSRLQVPARVVHGRRDTVVPPWAAERLAARIPDAELRWFEGGHGTIYRDGAVIAEALQ